MIRALVLAVALGIAAPSVAHADEVVTTVTKGERVPFDGTLFNTEAAAKLLSDLKFTEHQCQIRTEKELGEQKARMQFQIDKLEAKVELGETLCDQRLSIRDEQINMLITDLERARKPNRTGWYVGGVVSGIALTVLSGWAVGQAAGN